MDGYEQLANAVILKAVDDYRTARQILVREPRNILAQQEVAGCERFFLSSWFQVLTNIDGASLLENLKKAKEYLTNTNVEDIDEEYFDKQFDIEEGLKHIVLF